MYNILVKCNLIGSIRFLKNKYVGLMKPAHAAYLESIQDNQQFPGAAKRKRADYHCSYSLRIKEKRNGTVKARSCANGSVQREHVAKEEAASPTVALESENREVLTIDIPGAFLMPPMTTIW